MAERDEQFGQIGIECLRQPLQKIERWVEAPLLDAADIRPIDLGIDRKIFLRHAPAASKPPEVPRDPCPPVHDGEGINLRASEPSNIFDIKALPRQFLPLPPRTKRDAMTLTSCPPPKASPQHQLAQVGLVFSALAIAAITAPAKAQQLATGSNERNVGPWTIGTSNDPVPAQYATLKSGSTEFDVICRSEKVWGILWPQGSPPPEVPTAVTFRARGGAEESLSQFEVTQRRSWSIRLDDPGPILRALLGGSSTLTFRVSGPGFDRTYLFATGRTEEALRPLREGCATAFAALATAPPSPAATATVPRAQPREDETSGTFKSLSDYYAKKYGGGGGGLGAATSQTADGTPPAADRKLPVARGQIDDGDAAPTSDPRLADLPPLFRKLAEASAPQSSLPPRPSARPAVCPEWATDSLDEIAGRAIGGADYIATSDLLARAQGEIAKQRPDNAAAARAMTRSQVALCLPATERSLVEREAANRAEEERVALAKTPRKKLIGAYRQYAIVRTCYESRLGFAAVYVPEPEMETLRGYASAIQEALVAADSSINVDEAWRVATSSEIDPFAGNNPVATANSMNELSRPGGSPRPADQPRWSILLPHGGPAAARGVPSDRSRRRVDEEGLLIPPSISPSAGARPA